MISAVLYSTQGGSCAKYAQMIAEAVGVPSKPLEIGFVGSGEVVYVGWLMAGHVVGLREARKHYKIAAVVQVGMGPVTRGSEVEGRKANKVNYNTAYFCKQGGFDINKLPPVQKTMMTLMNKKLEHDLLKKSRLNAQEQALYVMVTTGSGEPAEWNVDDVVAFCRK